jgi:CHAT domain-containing protein
VIYRQIEREELRPESGSNSTTQRLLNEARDHERSLEQALADAGTRDREYSSLEETSGDLDAILAAIPPNARLVEYYEARGTLIALVAGGPELEIVPLGPTEAAHEPLRLLQFQLSKFRLGNSYAARFADVLRASTLAHLEVLFRQLIAPIRHLLEAKHLIIVPHSFLHCVPFHALVDGDRFLIDDFSVSYAPSASVYQLCASKPAGQGSGALVIGVPDVRAPSIDEEALRVATALPAATLKVAREGQEKLLRTMGPQARFIHIAAHGLFREDNPLFSSVVLGDSRLSVFDLHELHLSAELVTLSGCGTGINAVRGGDELIGLVRGFLHAGARSVLVSLWDVHDDTTAVLMETFYREMLVAPDKAQALRTAMLRLRDSHPHPYFWAPFALIGQVF